MSASASADLGSLSATSDNGSSSDHSLGVSPYAIAGIPVTFVLALVGSMLPPFLARWKRLEKFDVLNTVVFRFFFGIAAGTILAVGFVHSVPEASELLACEDGSNGEVCNSNYPNYPWGGFFAMIGALLTFFVEITVSALLENSRLGHSHSLGSAAHEEHCHAHEAIDSLELGNYQRKGSTATCTSSSAAEVMTAKQLEKQHLELPKSEQKSKGDEASVSDVGSDASEVTEEDILIHQKRMRLLTEMVILWCGLSFHSFFVGFALGLEDSGQALFIAIVVHQGFEALALGFRVAKSEISGLWVIMFDLAFAATTPIGIGIAMGVKQSLTDKRVYNSVDGTFNAFSGGILIYVALVHTIAEEYSDPIVKKSWPIKISMTLGLLGGAAVMSVIAIWA